MRSQFATTCAGNFDDDICFGEIYEMDSGHEREVAVVLPVNSRRLPVISRQVIAQYSCSDLCFCVSGRGRSQKYFQGATSTLCVSFLGS